MPHTRHELRNGQKAKAWWQKLNDRLTFTIRHLIWKPRSVTSTSTWSCGLWRACPHSSHRPLAQRAGLRRLNNAGRWQVPAPGPSAAPHFGPRSYIMSIKALQPLCLNEEKFLHRIPDPESLGNPKVVQPVLSMAQIFLWEINSLFVLILQKIS